MTKEEDIKSALAKRFPYLDGKIRVQRARRIFVDLATDKFKEVFEYAIDELGFCIFSTITGLDEGSTLGFIYHVAREDGIILSMKINVDKNNPVLETVTGYFPCADIYERELVDLLGVKVEGLPKGNRYPLSDDWPEGEYPLRKDWKAGESKK